MSNNRPNLGSMFHYDVAMTFVYDTVPIELTQETVPAGTGLDVKLYGMFVQQHTI